MIIILLDQLKSEHAVDIFQAVRALQQQRPGMITSLVGLIMSFLPSISSLFFALGTI
jgi:hypothetical protein